MADVWDVRPRFLIEADSQEHAEKLVRLMWDDYRVDRQPYGTNVVLQGFTPTLMKRRPGT